VLWTPGVAGGKLVFSFSGEDHADRYDTQAANPDPEERNAFTAVSGVFTSTISAGFDGVD